MSVPRRDNSLPEGLEIEHELPGYDSTGRWYFVVDRRRAGVAEARRLAMTVTTPEIDADSRAKILERLEVTREVLLPHVALPLEFGAVSPDSIHVVQQPPGKRLCELITDHQGLPATNAERILRHLLIGLQGVHALGIAHGDVRPENVFVQALDDSPLNAHLANLAIGPIKRWTNGKLATPGAEYYRDPNGAENKEPTAAGDLYAVGMVACEMLLGRDGNPLKNGAADIWPTIVPELRKIGVSTALREMLKSLLAENPDSRPRSALDAMSKWESLRQSDRTRVWRFAAGAATVIALFAILGVFDARARVTRAVDKLKLELAAEKNKNDSREAERAETVKVNKELALKLSSQDEQIAAGEKLLEELKGQHESRKKALLDALAGDEKNLKSAVRQFLGVTGSGTTNDELAEAVESLAAVSAESMLKNITGSSNSKEKSPRDRLRAISTLFADRIDPKRGEKLVGLTLDDIVQSELAKLPETLRGRIGSEQVRLKALIKLRAAKNERIDFHNNLKNLDLWLADKSAEVDKEFNLNDGFKRLLNELEKAPLGENVADAVGGIQREVAARDDAAKQWAKWADERDKRFEEIRDLLDRGSRRDRILQSWWQQTLDESGAGWDFKVVRGTAAPGFKQYRLLLLFSDQKETARANHQWVYTEEVVAADGSILDYNNRQTLAGPIPFTWKPGQSFGVQLWSTSSFTRVSPMIDAKAQFDGPFPLWKANRAGTVSDSAGANTLNFTIDCPGPPRNWK